MLRSFTRFLATLLGLGVLALVCAAAWFGYQSFYAKDIALREKERELARQQQEIEQLQGEVAAKAREIARLETAMRLLKVDHRVALIDVLEQLPAEGDRRLQTRFRFVEINDEGNAIGEPRAITIEGDLVYVDYWIVKFEDELVEQGDPLRNSSICLLRRIFGEFQEPREGVTIDEVGSRPRAYGQAEAMTDFEREIWSNFWRYATDPAFAKSAGVRAAHGEAVSTRLAPGKRFRVTLRASDGLSITAETAPPTPPEAQL